VVSFTNVVRPFSCSALTIPSDNITSIWSFVAIIDEWKFLVHLILHICIPIAL
jgi:hypothetical protein